MKNSSISKFSFPALFFLSFCFLLSCSKESLEMEEELTYELSAQTAEEKKLIEGHYIVVISEIPGKKNPRALAALEALSKEVGQMPEAGITRKYSNVLTGFAAKLTEKQVQKLRNDPRVESVEQDSKIYPAGEVSVQPSPDWGLDRIDQRDGELDQSYSYSSSGKGVTAYIVDTGVRDTHDEFENRAQLGHDFVWEDEAEVENRGLFPGEDCWGHGTAVAAVLGGAQSGVAKDVDIRSVRVWGCEGEAPVSRILEAVDWITENAKHPAVVNMGGAHAQSLIAVAIQNSIETGIVYTGVAGNKNEDTCANYTSDTSGILTVGASDIDNQRYVDSNYGDCVDLYAPGVDISTASFQDDNSYQQFSGTSMSAPMVAGVAALILERYPEATPAQTKSLIISNSTPNAITNVPSGTNNLLYSLWESEITLPSPPNLNLSATGEKVRSNYVANLSWDPTPSQYVIIYIDGIRQPANHFNDGEQQITLPKKGKDATYIIQICDASYGYCSEEVSLIFGRGSEEESANQSPKAAFEFSTDLLDVQFRDSSTDVDGSITAWSWDFGDGNSSSVQDPTHTYNQAGTYTVRLTVTDDSNNSGSASQSITVGEEEPTPGQFDLSGTGYKVKGQWHTDLSWSPSSSAGQVEIHRNGAVVETMDNTGSFTDQTSLKGSGSLNYKICEIGNSSSCSNEITVQF